MKKDHIEVTFCIVKRGVNTSVIVTSESAEARRQEWSAADLELVVVDVNAMKQTGWWSQFFPRVKWSRTRLRQLGKTADIDSGATAHMEMDDFVLYMSKKPSSGSIRTGSGKGLKRRCEGTSELQWRGGLDQPGYTSLYIFWILITTWFPSLVCAMMHTLSVHKDQ